MKDEEKSREELIEELADLRGQLARLEAAVQGRARVEALLGALNQASKAMGRALTPDQIYAAVAGELDRLAITCMILPFDADRQNLRTTYISTKTKVLRAAEALAGLEFELFSLPAARLEKIALYRQVVQNRQTVYVPDLKVPLAQALPGLARGVTGQVVRLLRLRRSVVAPLILGDEVIGILTVASDDLTEGDIPAVSAFAYQVAGAWHKAELYERAQKEIAERMRVEQESRSLREFNESIVQNMGEGIVVQDAEGRFTYLNPAAVAMLGYEAEELLGDLPMFLIPPDQAAIVEAADRRRAQGESDQYELEVLRKDGSRLPMLVSGTPRYQPGTGRFDGTLAVFTDLREQRRAHEELRSTSRLLQIIYDTIPDAIISVDAELKIVSCNPAVERVLGYRPEELIGESYPSLIPEEMLGDPSLRRREAELLATGYLSQEEYHLRRKNGETFTASFSVGLVRDEEGKTLGQVVSIRDITERKRTEQLLQVLDRAALAMERALTPAQIFQAVADTLGELGIACVIFPMDESESRFHTRYVSYDSKLLRAAEKLAGLDHRTFSVPVKALRGIELYQEVMIQRKTVLEKDLAAVLHQVLPRLTRPLAQQIIRLLGVPQAIIAPLATGDRTIGLFMAQSDHLGEEDVPAFSALAHQIAAAWRRAQLYEQAQQEIAERVQAEAERDCLLAEIQTQAQQMQATIDAMPEGVLLLDAQGGIILANPVAEGHLADLAETSSAGPRPQLIRLGDRRLSELVRATSAEDKHELAQAGRIFEIVAQPIEMGPTTGGWVLVLREVTQERAAQERMGQHERLAAVGQLAAGIAHDFNNIMAVIVLYSQMSLQVAGIPPKVQERLRTIVKQAHRASDLIQQILDFSRRAILERRPLDLVPLLKEEAKLLERTLPENIRVQVGYGPDEYIVNADPTRIQQVVMNLAVNARDAMPEGGELRIGLARLAVKEGHRPPLPEMGAGEWVLLTVADDGGGIPDTALPHIFEPFFTTKETGQGSGLGLAQVYGIVRQHGGFIGVETGPKQGTRFSIYLPSLRVGEKDGSSAEEEEPARGHGETILVVEDNPAAREALVSCLQELGYRVLTAPDGRRAVNLHRERGKEISLVITDMVMPEMGGRALSQQLRRQSPAVKVVALSGYPRDEGTMALAPDFVDWLQKPVTVDRLAEVIARALDSHQ
jgi:two-component system cell cycle sensor histidine kinase/response regulator CckA